MNHFNMKKLHLIKTIVIFCITNINASVNVELMAMKIADLESQQKATKRHLENIKFRYYMLVRDVRYAENYKYLTESAYNAAQKAYQNYFAPDNTKNSLYYILQESKIKYDEATKIHDEKRNELEKTLRKISKLEFDLIHFDIVITGEKIIYKNMIKK